MPPGRLRPARAGRADARRRAPRGARSVDVATTQPSPFARTPAVRLRRPVRVRGRLPHRRAPGRRARRSTRACWPSCSAGPSCASCSTPRCSPRSRPSCSGSPPTAGPATPRASPTCSGCSGPLTHRRGDRRAASTAPTSPAGSARSPTPRRVVQVRIAGERALVRASRTSPGCATGSASRCRPAPPRRSPSRSRTRSATWSAATPAPTARSPPTRSPTRLGLGVAVVRQTLQRLGRAGPGARGRVPAHRLRLGVVRRRGAAPAAPPLAGPAAQGGRAGRARGARPVPAGLAARVDPARGRGALRGVDGVLTVGRAARRLPGARLRAGAAGAAAGSRDYQPAYLDELTATGEVLWAGHGALPGTDGWVSLHLADPAPLTLPEPGARSSTPSCTRRCSTPWRPGGAWFFRQLADAGRRHRRHALVGRRSGTSSGPAGSATTPSRPLRALTRGGTHQPTAPGGRRRAPAAPSPGGRPGCRRAPARPRPPAAGRCCPRSTPTPPGAAHATAERLLDRHGVVTRGAVVSERVPGGFAAVYKVLSAFEDSGRCRRGYFVGGLGRRPVRHRRRRRPAAHLRRGRAGDASPVARHPGRDRPGQPVRRRAALARPSPRRSTARRPATDPAARPAPWWCWSTARSTLYVERGGRTLLTWTDDARRCSPRPRPSLADAARRGLARPADRRAGRRRAAARLRRRRPLRAALAGRRLRRDAARAAAEGGSRA